jgi:hypothetical protein
VRSTYLQNTGKICKKSAGHTSSQDVNMEIKSRIYLQLFKEWKCLGINLIKLIEDFAENHTMLMKEIKEYLNVWRKAEFIG